MLWSFENEEKRKEFSYGSYGGKNRSSRDGFSMSLYMYMYMCVRANSYSCSLAFRLVPRFHTNTPWRNQYKVRPSYLPARVRYSFELLKIQSILHVEVTRACEHSLLPRHPSIASLGTRLISCRIWDVFAYRALWYIMRTQVLTVDWV